MNKQLNPTKETKENEKKNESLNETVFTSENNLICIDDEKIFDDYIKIKGNLNVIDFMNEFANEMYNIYDNIKIIGKNFKFNIIIKMEEENLYEKNDEKKDKDSILENSEENEKELNIRVELFRVKNDEFILNFIKRKGELSDYYQQLGRIMKYAQDFI